jgi:hypothetical protein
VSGARESVGFSCFSCAWCKGLVKFLELSGVGRVMADGTDEDGAYAARMDEWVAWESVERAAPRGEG